MDKEQMDKEQSEDLIEILERKIADVCEKSLLIISTAMHCDRCKEAYSPDQFLALEDCK